MSAFPTAGSTIYRNEEGEVLGWDTPGYDEPDYQSYEDERDNYERYESCDECGMDSDESDYDETHRDGGCYA